MKFSELKSKFKNKYVMRIAAGILSVALLGTGYGAYHVTAAKNSGDSVKEESTEVTEESAGKKEVNNAIESILSDAKTASETESGKEETVYLIADADGTVNKTIVSDWLKNKEGSDTLEDSSDLTDIENVKGSEKFTQNGEALTWNAGGKDIFYQGTTTKESPITEKITYSLDGKEMSAKEIAGKSGKVTIRFDYTNNEKTTATINGEEKDIYVPFTVVSGMMLDDTFTNVEVKNGKLISDGKNNVVVGVAMPGLEESLDVKKEDFNDDVQFPDYVEVTADVKDFSLDMTMSVATSGLLSSAGMEGMDLTQLDDAIGTLTDSSDQLVDGSGTLSDGADKLLNAINQYTAGAQTLASGIDQLASGINTLASSAPTLASGAGQLSSGISSARSGADTLNSKIQGLSTGLTGMLTQVGGNASQYSTAADQASGGNYSQGEAQGDAAALTTYKSALSAYTSATVGYAVYADGVLAAVNASYGTSFDFPNNITASPEGIYSAVNIPEPYATAVNGQLQGGAYYDAYVGAAANLQNATTTLCTYYGASRAADVFKGLGSQLSSQGLTADNMKALAGGMQTLDSGLQQLDSGASQLCQGTSQLQSGASQLQSGVSQLQSGAQTLVANNAELNKGAQSLSDGADELASGMAQFDEEGIRKIANSYNGDVKGLLDRIDAIVDAGTNYQIFSKVNDGVNGEVKFVFKTDSVKADDEK